MATEFNLRRADGQPFGSFETVQSQIRRLFPAVQFSWTTSGPEKIRQAEANGVELPPHIRQWIETLPSLLEGIAEGKGYHVAFGLGCEEPVSCLCIEPRGEAPELRLGLAALEAEAGTVLKVAGAE